MTRITSFSNPFLLGFDMVERALERVAKSGDGYPPYNIQRLTSLEDQSGHMRLRITLAVAGFACNELEVLVEDSQLIISGSQLDENHHEYLHRGIAARQFQRIFVLADGIIVLGAELKHGLLLIDLSRPQPEKRLRRINILTNEE